MCFCKESFRRNRAFSLIHPCLFILFFFLSSFLFQATSPPPTSIQHHLPPVKKSTSSLTAMMQANYDKLTFESYPGDAVKLCRYMKTELQIRESNVMTQGDLQANTNRRLLLLKDMIAFVSLYRHLAKEIHKKTSFPTLYHTINLLAGHIRRYPDEAISSMISEHDRLQLLMDLHELEKIFQVEVEKERKESEEDEDEEGLSFQ